MSHQPREVSWLIFFCALTSLVTFLFSPGLFHGYVPAFRDTYHFYYPQAVWLDSCAQEQCLFPMWNQLEGLGNSVPGQLSSALYYPLRIFFFTPGLSVAQRLALFSAAHLLIAAAGMAFAARRLGLSVSESQLAATAYALSCPVLFQHNNLIYLCSAAWLGFGVAAWHALWTDQPRKPAWIGLLTFTLSMMVLAGDPHTAVNGLILAVSSLAILAWKTKSFGRTLSPAISLTFALGLTSGLTLAQWLPAWRWSQHSNRLSSGTPLQLSSQISEAQQLALQPLQTFELSSQLIYEFSLSPWHLLTCIWPTLWGHYLPQHSRWLDAFPAEGRMWIPSLYLGLVPLAISVWAACRRDGKNRWLLAWAAFALAASLGNYSPIWCFREVLSGLGMHSWLSTLPSDETISLYNLLVWLVPGYDGFRFPAKWTVWFVAAIALLAGSNLKAFLHENQSWRLSRWLMIGVSGLVVIGAGVLLWTRVGDWVQRFQPADPWLGQASADAIALTLFVAGAVPAFLLVIVPSLARPSILSAEANIVCLTLADLGLVACCWVCFVPAPSPTQLRANLPTRAQVWSNVFQANLETQTPDRNHLPTRQTQLQNSYLLGKLASAAAIGNLGAQQSIDLKLVEKLKLWLASVDNLEAEQEELDTFLARLGVTHRLQTSHNASEPALRWRAIADPAALCECWSADGKRKLDVPVTWTWEENKQLRIQVSTNVESRLVVRQFSDGGWEVHCEQWQAESVVESPALFIEIPIPAGDSHVLLQRKIFW